MSDFDQWEKSFGFRIRGLRSSSQVRRTGNDRRQVTKEACIGQVGGSFTILRVYQFHHSHTSSKFERRDSNPHAQERTASEWICIDARVTDACTIGSAEADFLYSE